MLKSGLINITSTFFKDVNIPNGLPIWYQSIRWHRKPRWVPVAKSKMFRIPQHRKQTEEEKRELMRLHNNYRTQMRSISSYLHTEYLQLNAISTADHLIVTPEEEKLEFARVLAVNDEWNLKIAGERNIRLEKEAAERREYILSRLVAKEARDQEAFQRAEEIVRLQKERAKSFISKENLDEAIELALANPVDYNFCLDIKGNMYRGSSSFKEPSISTESDMDMNDSNPLIPSP